MGEQYEFNLNFQKHEVPKEVPVVLDEFAGMSREDLVENIKTQQTRLSSGIVDREERFEIEALIERMQERVKEEPLRKAA